uniref:BBS1 domain-containing protein n=1 Tax=Elaeophora elaphi TaxID=1147741 RepID=A0A0R3RYF7_9BILA
MTVTHNADIIILNGTDLVSYRNGRKYHVMKLPVLGKSLSAFEDEMGLERIIALGRSNDVLFVFTNDLKPIEEIYFKNDAKETCNFAILHQKYYYISCQSAILQLSEVGLVNFSTHNLTWMNSLSTIWLFW